MRTLPARPAFGYVDNADGILNPYLELVKRYGWANYMFQTNQGPSLPAHQFLFGATSAPSASDDARGTFVSENAAGNRTNANAGCASPPNVLIQLIDANGVERHRNRIFPCTEHRTVSDILLPAEFDLEILCPGSRHDLDGAQPHRSHLRCRRTNMHGGCVESQCRPDLQRRSARYCPLSAPQHGLGRSHCGQLGSRLLQHRRRTFLGSLDCERDRQQ